ncbi:hypothetical protein [Burkholderia anthina]|uniref:hypothetical protein n=1 Tax=Burkholderia anthina TaxID=179879 RepID=UPI00158F0D3F|nr:hypothetical protein [Burkholderia anthina]MBY4871212.1 hypothetical protein [Burkholderia anthina]
MINYIALTGDPIEVRRLYASAKEALESTLTFAPVAWSTKISESGVWAYVACAVSEDELSRRVAVSQRGFFLINGPVLRFGDNLDVAHSGLGAMADSDPEVVFDALAGSYNCASVTLRNGLVAFPDFSGTYPIYKREMNGAAIVSNRASALAGLEPARPRNLTAMSWLIGHANVFGSESPYVDVENITAGAFYRTKLGSAQGALTPFVNQVWPSGEGESPMLDDLTENEWAEITDELVKNVKAAASQLGDPLRLSLTGGKDSRLTLALAIGAGLGERIETFTNGPEGSPEIDCAKSVAAVAGVRHNAFVSRAARNQQDFDTSWRRLRQHAYRFDGYVCPWDGAGSGEQHGTFIEMTGFGGELYRGPGGHAKQFKNLAFLTEENLISKWVNYHQRMDPLAVLRDRYKEIQVDWLQTWLDENQEKTRIDVLPEKFFVENRLSHWNGPLAQNVIGRVKLMPLLSPKVARLVFKLHPHARALELFHYSVMAKLAPRLVEHPFLNAQWDSTLQGRFGLQAAPTPWNSGVKAPPRSIQAWQCEFVENQRTQIVDLLSEARQQTKIDEIFDVEKLNDIVMTRPEFQVVDTKVVLSGIGIAHSLLERLERVGDTV